MTHLSLNLVAHVRGTSTGRQKRETDGDAAGHKQANDNGRHKNIVRQIAKGIVEQFFFKCTLCEEYERKISRLYIKCEAIPQQLLSLAYRLAG